MRCKCKNAYFTSHGIYFPGDIYTYEIVSHSIDVTERFRFPGTMRVFDMDNQYSLFNDNIFDLYFEPINDTLEDEIWEDISDELDL